MEAYDVLIVGGGAAGMTAAYTIKKRNPKLRVIMAERDECLGGVLRQCIHSGFGLGYFGEDMTGPAYAGRLAKRLEETSVEIRLNTEVVQIAIETDSENLRDEALSPGRVAYLAGPGGWEKISFRELILASGCRERAIGSLGISGTRPSGVFGAGQLQRMMNLGQYDPGKIAVILGSGDIGMIVARRLILNGKTVKCMVEIQQDSPAMERNRRRCLEAYAIPLRVNSQITKLYGAGRLEGVAVRDNGTGKEEYLSCDMLVVAAGLIPERSLVEPLDRNGLPAWVHLCGNCDYIHPIVDSVSREAEQITLPHSM